MRQAYHPEPGEMTLVAVLGALSDPIRIGLVRVLSDGRERGWGQLRAPVAKSTLSHHLRVLRDAASPAPARKAPAASSNYAVTTWTPASPASWTPSSKPPATTTSAPTSK